MLFAFVFFMLFVFGKIVLWGRPMGATTCKPVHFPVHMPIDYGCFVLLVALVLITFQIYVLRWVQGVLQATTRESVRFLLHVPPVSIPVCFFLLFGFPQIRFDRFEMDAKNPNGNRSHYVEMAMFSTAYAFAFWAQGSPAEL